MSGFDRLASGAAWNVAGKVIQIGVTLAALVVIARLVGPEAYGVFALTWVSVGLIEIFAIMAPIDTLVQRRELVPGHLNATLWGSLSIALLGWSGLVVAAVPLAELLEGGPMLAEILPARAATLPLGALAVVPTALLMRAARFKALAVVESLTGIVSSAVGLASAFAGAGVWSLVAMELARGATALALASAATHWRPGVAMRRHHLTDLLGFNASTWGAWGVMYCDGQLPRALIARSLGPMDVGIYSLALRIYGQVVTLLVSPAYQVVQSGVARIQDETAAVRGIALATMRASAVLSCPLFLGIGALAPVLIPTLFGAQWSQAVPVVQVMMLFAIRSPVAMVQMAIIRGMGKAHWHFGVSLIGLALTLVLLLAALPWGLVAVAAAMGVRGLVLFPANAILVRRLTGLSLREQALSGAGAFAASVLMAVWVWTLVAWLAGSMPNAGLIPLAAVAGALFYWSVLRLFSPGAAAVLDRMLLAVLRRDLAAVRAALRGGTA